MHSAIRRAEVYRVKRKSVETSRLCGLSGRRDGAALVTIAEQPTPPLRVVAGADAVAAVEQRIVETQAQIDAYRDLSSNLTYDTVSQ